MSKRELTQEVARASGRTLVLPAVLPAVLLAVLLAVMGLSGCDRESATPKPDDGGEQVGITSGRLLSPAPTPGLSFRLRDADPSAPVADAEVRTHPGVPLSPEAIRELLSQLPPLPESAAVTTTFSFRPGPQPPPQSGETVRMSFPAPTSDASRPQVATGPLSVSRFQPVDDVAIASHVAVTFDQPMVPLARVEALAASDVPVRLSPQPDGAWRWVGTQTLLFEPDVRFPMATEYQVVVPAGTVSATGGTLAQDVSWTFRTPPPSLVESYPIGGPVDLEPLVLLGFDQEVRPDDVLAHTIVTADGNRVDMRRATPEEIDGDEYVASWVDGAHADRFAVLRPVEALPKGVDVLVTVGPGLPSAEGPRPTEDEETFGFEVYAELAVTELSCSGGGSRPLSDPAKGCLPLGGWSISFNNPLDPSTVDQAAIEVSPEVPELRVEQHGATLQLSGLTRGQTEYTVRLPASLGDVFGQTLGKPVEVQFETGDAEPMLSGPGSDMVVLDPSGPRDLTLLSVNNDALDVALYNVRPDDWTAYLLFSERLGQADAPAPPGDPVWQGTVRPSGKRDTLVSVPIDLSQALEDGLGHVVVVAQPSGWQPEGDQWMNRPVVRWVQATELGLTSLGDGDEVVAWVTSLADGTPLPGVSVSLRPAGADDVTDADGVAVLASLPDREREWPPREMLVASVGADEAFLPGTGGSDWFEHRAADTLVWYAFEDRGIYKPGETVHVKGWVRRDDLGKGGDLAALTGGAQQVEFQLTTPNGVESVSGAADLDVSGGFDLAFELPAQIELGAADLMLTVVGNDLPEGGREHMRTILVSEFRRPEFEVAATPERPYYVAGDPAIVTARAGYFAGGALPGADVRWFVVGSATTYRPPGHDDFHFGSTLPWWARPEPMYGIEMAYASEFVGFPPTSGATATEEHEGVTDGAGEHRLAIDLVSLEPVGPVSFRAEATVEDVNRQAWTGSAAVLMHPAEHYVGLRLDRPFAEVGDPVSLDVIVVDLDGVSVTGSSVAVAAERVEWVLQGSQYVEDLAPAGTCDVTSGADPTACTFEFDRAGEYRLSAEIADDRGRLNQSSLQISVAGEGAPPSRGLASDEARLLSDADSYEPGDVAEILVQAPFSSAEGLMTVQRGGIVRTERFAMDGASHRLSVPIEDGQYPNVFVQVDLVGAAAVDETSASGNEPVSQRPAFATGVVELNVPPLARTLAVETASEDDTIEPGGSVRVDTTVRDAEGMPLADADVALVVVDEAVWSLTGYEVPDPIQVLYPARWSNVDKRDGRAYVQLAVPADVQEDARSGAMDMRAEAGILLDSEEGESSVADGMVPEASMPSLMTAPAAKAFGDESIAVGSQPPGGSSDTVAERTDLDPLAAFLPDLRTDATGRVSVEVTVPDNVTRYRIVAVATDGARRFGKGESTLTARLPLTLRPSAPRFLNFGDTFELPIVVQNQTDRDLDADVVVRAANLTFTADQGLQVTVPAGDRIEVRFPASADMPGTAVVQAGVFGADASDAQRVELPVWTPATTEAFATYGHLDEGALLQPVVGPTDVVTAFGGLALQTSSTALSELSDAYAYLREYPFEGSEHVASRMVAAVALADVAEAFAAGDDGFTRVETDAAIRRDIEKLRGMQAPDGGFGWWSAQGKTDPFLTVHVTHALVRAEAKGFEVSDEVLSRAMSYLTDIESRLDPALYGEQAIRAIRAYALFARALAGDVDTAKGQELFAESDDHTIDTLGWLLFVLHGDLGSAGQAGEIRRLLNNRAAEEAGTAQFTESYEESDGNLVLASNRRSDAIALESLIVDQPDNDLIPKVVAGLLAHRTKGRWASTQENAFVLLALDRYFRTYEGEEPDFVARAWLDEGFLGETSYRGRTPDRTVVDVPMAVLEPGATTGVTLQKDGPGRLYFRLGLSYAPADLALEPLERGFSVTRVYESVDDPADVRRTADGTWEIRAGARVRVRLTMVAPQRRYQVALVDPLPAGLEALNPDLATTGTQPPDESGGDDEIAPFQYGWWRWFDHSAFRDERVEAFGGLVWPGVHEYTYVARATTPGSFVVPPAKAEEMYHPETFGRTATDRVVVR